MASQASAASGINKRKQSKSRNGCITCKAKRLKCDEKKPTCEQCARRAVPCGGYKKDFKWRPFEEPTIKGKPIAKSQKDDVPQLPILTQPQHQNHINTHSRQNDPTGTPHNPGVPPPQQPFHFMHTAPIRTSFPQPLTAPVDNMVPASPGLSLATTHQLVSPVDSHAPTSSTSCSTFGAESMSATQGKSTSDSATSSGQSPRLVDLLMPGTDLSVPPEEYSSFLTQHEAFYQPTGLTPPPPTDDAGDGNGNGDNDDNDNDDDDDAELVYQVHQDSGTWVMPLPSPAPSKSDSSSPESPMCQIPAQIQLSCISAESLSRRYHRDTCGVLSIKDGPTENPWRTLIWPLTQDCPALYHAVVSMTSFHQSKDLPILRIQGIDHMRSAVRALAAGLPSMRVDAAISTTLVLAFAESWDQHISTGINHIKGAKVLINQALMQHRAMPMRGEEWTRLKFLCNTWIYMDVLARLTSTDNDETYEVDAVRESIYATGETDTTLDPLMGSAHTLFPIIGRVANLVRKVRRSSRNTSEIIAQAVHLKSQLEDWTPPSFIEDPEDETTRPCDTIRTATAYQYATLLYLHQAVPEIPSPPSDVLAKRILCELATVDPGSRSIIVHIYPLMAAGCEATTHEEREWIKTRWELMSSRMKLGIIERCLEVTKEVWSRRDAFAAEHMAMQVDDACAQIFPSQTPLQPDSDDYSYGVNIAQQISWQDSQQWEQAPRPCPSSVDPEFTVKGRLHWLGVMKDWNWEILLG